MSGENKKGDPKKVSQNNKSLVIGLANSGNKYQTFLQKHLTDTCTNTHAMLCVNITIALLLHHFKGQVTFTYRIRGRKTIFSQKKGGHLYQRGGGKNRLVLFFFSFFLFFSKGICFKDCSLYFGATLFRERKERHLLVITWSYQMPCHH